MYNYLDFFMTQPAKLQSSAPIKKIDNETDSPTQRIESRRTDELVIALCGAVGSGVSTLSKKVDTILKAKGYTTSYIKISELIGTTLKKKPVEGDSFKRTQTLQDQGNQLREDHGSDILAQLVIKEIAGQRNEQLQDEDESSDKIVEKTLTRRRYATIIDSLKNPYEVELLKKVYGNMFHIFGVLCNDVQRKERLQAKSMTDSQAVQLMERDKNEKESFGQQLLKTLQHADFFIRNNRPNTNSLDKPISRFVDLMLGQNNITPTNNEFGMYIAESAARRSGCISRQVGAAILTEGGDIVSTGRNDVPKPRGGLYGEDDDGDDCRCFKVYDKACQNEKNKKQIYQSIEQILKETLEGDTSTDKVSQISDKIQNNSVIKDLLEYSRAVHAEMDAITSAAKIGHFPLKETILFSTTFPCHHCARHIVASGIKKVYYIEPYEKSLAIKLHSDAIELNSTDGSNESKKVIFSHFEGVAPKQYLNLFSCNNRKKQGRLQDINLTTHRPTAATYLDTFLDYEAQVTKLVDEALSDKEDKNDE
ncbi:MAG TPA: deoxycytidylate deaminase [Desulfobacterales bacterium]|nr:deoxycytidylate deaminase [Desulfobacterales bacterium]